MSRKLNQFGTKVPLRDRMEHVRPPTNPELPRRMTRLTNAASKKAANHAQMMAIYFMHYKMHYNFVRIHQTFKITPAKAAGVTPKLWEMSDMVKVLEEGRLLNENK
jgi:hypothetical protein